jgi:hypothetical protein
MFRNLSIILIVLLSGFFYAKAGALYLQNKKLSIKIHTIGNTEYVLAEDLHKYFEEIIDYSENKLFLNNVELKFSVGSFFIVYESKEKMKVHQMPAPPVEYRDKIYLPFIGIFNAFRSFDVFSVDIRDNDVYVYSESKTNNKSEKKQIDIENTAIREITETETKPNKTPVTPENLKRKKAETPIAGERTGTNIYQNFYSVSDDIMQYFNYKKTNRKDTFKREEYPPDIYLLPQNLKRNQNIKNNKENE